MPGMGDLRAIESKTSTTKKTTNKTTTTKKTTNKTKTTKKTTTPTPNWGQLRKVEATMPAPKPAPAPAPKPVSTPSWGQLRQIEAPPAPTYGALRKTEAEMPSYSQLKPVTSSGSSSSGGSSSLFRPISQAEATKYGMDYSYLQKHPTFAAVVSKTVAPLYRLGMPVPETRTPSSTAEDILNFAAMYPGVGAIEQAGRAIIPRVIPKVTETVSKIAPVAERAAYRGAEVGETLGRGIINAGSNLASKVQTGVGTASNLLKTGAQIAAKNWKPIVGVGAAGGLAYSLMPRNEAPAPTPTKTAATPTPSVVSPADQGSIARPAPVYSGGGDYSSYGPNTMTPAAQAQPQAQTDTGWPTEGIPWDQVDWNALNGQNTMQQPVGQPEVQPPDWNQMMQDMLAAIDQIGQQNAALTTSWLDQMTSTIDSLQNQITQMYQQQGTNLDPATLAALKEIRDQVSLRRQQLMEEMNRRGLLQSGIWLEEENRILNNQLSSEEKLLAGRLADIQNRLTDSMMEFAKQRLNIMGTLAQNQMGNAQWMGEQKLSTIQDINKRKEEWDKWWAEQQRLAKEAQLEQQRWQYEQGQQQKQWEAEFGLKQQQYGLDVTKAQQQNALGWARLQQSASKANSATQKYLSAIPSYGNLQEALNAYNQFKSQMLADGADTAEILRNIYSYFS